MHAVYLLPFSSEREKKSNLPNINTSILGIKSRNDMDFYLLEYE